jgi:hypothetical protein
MRPGDAGQLHEPCRVPVSRVPVRVAFLKMPLQKEDENLNYQLLCQQPGIDLVVGSYRSFSQRVVAWGAAPGQYWNSYWSRLSRVEAEDEAMRIGPWVARKRKAFFLAGQIRSRDCKLQCSHDHSASAYH